MKLSKILSLVVVLFFAFTQANFSNLPFLGNYVSHTFTETNTQIQCENGKVEIQPYTDDIIRVHFYPSNLNYADAEYVVIQNPLNININTEEFNDYLQIKTAKVTIKIDKYPFRMSYYRGDNLFLEEEEGYFHNLIRHGTKFKLKPDEAIYGTGSRALPINRRNTEFTCWNQNKVYYSNGEGTLNIHVPLIISSELYGVYFEDIALAYFIIDKNHENVLEYGAETRINYSYYIINGDSYADILEKYTYLTGKQPLPPRWAFGYHQSRYCYISRQEASNIVDSMTVNDFPLESIVFDFCWFGNANSMGNFEWDTVSYPNPKLMIEEFNKKNIKTILINELYMATESKNFQFCKDNGFFAKTDTGDPFIVHILWSDKALLDIYNNEVSEWVWTKIKPLFDDNIAGLWCDLGEPDAHPWEMRHTIGDVTLYHNVFNLFWSKMLFEKYNNEFPDKRLFSIVRSGYAGSQRYAQLPWTGDTPSSWDGLQSQMRIMLGVSISGIAYMHSDIGGHSGTNIDNEVFVRWFQLGAFSPIMRVHCSYPREPFVFNDTIKPILRKYLKLRYRFLPYNYNLAYINSTTGSPITTPMNYFNVTDTNTKNLSDQYFWGENIIVAPVIDSAAISRKLYLTEGYWYNYWTNEVNNGNQFITVDAPLDILPLFVRAGSFIPMAKEINNTEEYNGDTLHVRYYPNLLSPVSSFTMFDDDGKSFNSIQNQEYQKITFSGMFGKDKYEIYLSKEGKAWSNAPKNRELIFEIQGIKLRPFCVSSKNINLIRSSSFESFYKKDAAYYWDSINSVLYAHFNWNLQNDTILFDNIINTVSEYKNINDFVLFNPMPNPTNNHLSIQFEINKSDDYYITIYNSLGQSVKKFNIEKTDFGKHEFTWNLNDDNGNLCNKGTYYIVISNGKINKMKKFIIID